MNQPILKGLSQLCLIVFSVVLGLYLSERIEDRKNEKEAEKLMAKIKSELNENKKLLDYWVPYHKDVIENLDSLSNSEKFLKKFANDKSGFSEIFTRGTMMSDTPANDAWDIAKSHPLIVNFDYNELLVLSKIYNQQKNTFESVPKMIDLMLSDDFNKKEKAQSNLKQLRNLLWDTASRESQLINYYNEGQEILNYQED